MTNKDLQELENLLNDNDSTSKSDFEVNEVRNGGKNTTVNWYFV